ncbi:hypothetical protein HTZ84_22155 [Haloterrigena sp. SYSU A558-1]|uniref:Uncharacterized protein n=1 Tax=Haloterrigena gelatinilytica TaxID=2741724 RepID=A0ABX2LPZ9_9EURY|nr:hypothetical protein [Haloterrigena gelatinilytica]NUC74971.1 hypothetical protein [Haloterrigena gelatinilytica]
MSTLQTERLKSSRNESTEENPSQTTSKPRVIGTSDGEVNVDLPATPSYERNYSDLIEEAVRQ